jgi:hypothetical protein
MGAVSLHEDDQRGDKEQEGGGTRVEEETFEEVFGQSVGETLKDTGREGVIERATKVEAVPSRKVAEEHNLERAVFRSWSPHWVKVRAEWYGRKKTKEEGGGVPSVSLDYMYMHSEQEKEGADHIIVVEDDKTKLVMAKAVPSKGVQECGVEVIRKFVEQLGYNKIIMQRAGDLGFEGGGEERRAWILSWRRHL